MLFTVKHLGGVILWFGGAVLALAGCHSTTHPIAPSVPRGESGIDLQVDAQTRSLEEAYRAYVQSRYSKASLLFKRFIELNSQSPRVNEARWWLARSYEAQGNIPAAVKEYRRLAGASALSSDSAASYRAHAVRRLADIMQTGGAAVLSAVHPVALSITHSDWSRIAEFSSWIAQVRNAGVTTLLLDTGDSVGYPNQSRAAGVYFKTSMVPVLDDWFARVIPLAHAEGVAVFARLDLHDATWMSPKPGWVSTIPNQSSTMPQPTNLVDVLHPEYQQAVSRIVDDLSRTGIDGLVFQARLRKGFAEESSPLSRAEFESKTGQSADEDPTNPLFWRWAGWKARSYLRFVEELKDRVRRERSMLLVAVTVHTSAVLDPQTALMDYGEDVLETRLRGFEVLVLPDAGLPFAAESARTEFMERMVETEQGERPLWLGTTLTPSGPEMIPAAIRATLMAMSEQPQVPLVLMNETTVP